MKKASFDELENTLTRTEMKNIMAGSGGGCDASNCFGCTPAEGWPCAKWQCINGVCVPRSSTCCQA